MNAEHSGNGQRRYRVSYSDSIRAEILKLQRQAVLVGRSQDYLTAFRRIVERLESAPMAFGEPLFNLPALKLQVRSAISRPIAISFAVSQETGLVFVRSIRLLSM